MDAFYMQAIYKKKISECYEFNLNYNFVKVLSCKNGFLLVVDVEREDDGTLLKHPQKPMAGNRARSLEQVFGKCVANQTAPSESISFLRACKLGEARFPSFALAPIRAKVFLLPMKTSLHPAFFSWDA